MSEEQKTQEEKRTREIEKSLLERGWERKVMERGTVVFLAPPPPEKEPAKSERKKKETT